VLVEPFVMAGSDVKPGQYRDIQMVDVAPTIAVLLGTNIPASSEGQPLLQTLNVDTARQALIHKVWSAQQVALASAYESAIGAPPQARDSAQARITAAQAAREAGELWPRSIIAFVVALIGAGILIWKRSRDVAMLTVGAVVYIVAYNLIFAVITGNVYSMSTVPPTSATDFIIEIAEFTLVAVIVAWLAAMLFSGAFRRGALHAAQATYGFAFITIYALFLPALLGFAVNGATTTWRLPDPLLSFLHFTNLMQAVFVAALGIVLSGVAALLGWWLKPNAES
jgi:hypothetical protein